MHTEKTFDKYQTGEKARAGDVVEWTEYYDKAGTEEVTRRGRVTRVWYKSYRGARYAQVVVAEESVVSAYNTKSLPKVRRTPYVNDAETFRRVAPESV